MVYSITFQQQKSSRQINKSGLLLRESFKVATTNEHDPKKPYFSVLIGTHSGNFHCDEALACYMLRLLPEYKDAR